MSRAIFFDVQVHSVYTVQIARSKRRCAAPGTASAEDVRRFIGSELNIRTLMDLRDEKEAGTQEDKAVSNQFIL